MVTRANHMDGLALPDYFVRVPTIVYTDSLGHRTRLRYDILEDEGDKVIYCRKCEKFYTSADTTFISSPEDAHNRLPDPGTIWVGYPPADGGALDKNGERPKMRGKGIARKYDDAIMKDRIVRMLVIGGLTQAEVATRLGITQPRVSQVASEVRNLLQESILIERDTVDLELLEP